MSLRRLQVEAYFELLCLCETFIHVVKQAQTENRQYIILMPITNVTKQNVCNFGTVTRQIIDEKILFYLINLMGRDFSEMQKGKDIPYYTRIITQ